MRIPLKFSQRVSKSELFWAVLLCLLLIALVVLTAGSSPLWIYQGF
jgi:hypothetical protein